MKRLTLALLLAFSLLPGVHAAEQSTVQEGDLGERQYVLLETTDGEILVELYSQRAPATVKNFVKYVEDGFYDKTTFHRVIKDFVVQGGGYTPDFEVKETREPVKNESRDSRLRNLRGTIAMARTNDPHSATSQFYFNLKDNSGLDWTGPYGGYTVFGSVALGMEDVVDDIAKIPTGPGPEDADIVIDRDVPFRPVYIIKASVVEPEEARQMIKAAQGAEDKSADEKVEK
ncbi:MAG: peptidylprolyl isomerase [Gammaproteobacteria bacterium]|nr:peptidylprolyl isomerase [Gammaproteobacteria bacterium]